MATEASTVEAMMPNGGTPAFDIFLNCAGNRPSFAAASGISAQIMVQPFKAPKPETITASAMTLPQNVPPNMTSAAVENGALVVANCVAGSTPKITVSES